MAEALRGYKPIAEALAEIGGTGFDYRAESNDGVDPRHALYRLSNRQEHPLPIDGPVSMPRTTREALAQWVAGERKRGGRIDLSRQLALVGVE